LLPPVHFYVPPKSDAEEVAGMNFDRATVSYPDGRVVVLTPSEFYAVPLSSRIELLTGGRIKFEKNDKQISALEALKKQQ